MIGLPANECIGFSARMTHRFVVPSALDELLLAEQTMATLCSRRLGLNWSSEEISLSKPRSTGNGKDAINTYRITWSTMLKANLPTLVPPNF